MRRVLKESYVARFRNEYSVLSKGQRRMFVLSIIAVLLVAIGFPAYSWFTSQKSLAVIGKVNAPYTLYLGSGNQESLMYLDMSSIDVGDATSTAPKHKDYVFCVQGSWDISEYYLQLAHTTNIPFKYTVYRVKKDDILTDADFIVLPASLQETSVSYIAHVDSDDYDKDQTIHYVYRINDAYSYNDPNGQFGKVMDEVNYVNRQGTTNIGIRNTSNTYYSQTYVDNSVSEVQMNAVPLYMQSGRIKKDSEATSGQDFTDYYILRVDWGHDSTIKNDKETDMVYITVVSPSLVNN